MSGKARRRVRVGLVGAGFVARLHAEAYHHVHGLDVELTCVTAARRERAARFADEFGVGRTRRWRWRRRARASTWS